MSTEIPTLTTAKHYKPKDKVSFFKRRGMSVLIYRGPVGFRVAISIPRDHILFGISPRKIPFRPGDFEPNRTPRQFNRRAELHYDVNPPVQVLEYTYEHSWDETYVGGKPVKIPDGAGAPIMWNTPVVENTAKTVVDMLDMQGSLVRKLLFHIPIKIIIAAKWSVFKAWLKGVLSGGAK